MPMYTAASPGNLLPKFSAPAAAGTIARLASLLQSMTGVADKDAPISVLLTPEVGVAGTALAYAATPTRTTRRAKANLDLIVPPPHLFELSSPEGSWAASRTGVRDGTLRPVPRERRVAAPRRARAPCRAPPTRAAGLPRRARPRARRTPGTRSRNEAPCPRPRGEGRKAPLD